MLGLIPSSLPLSVVKHGCPGGTYFRTSEVTPFVNEDGLNVYDGNGVSRSWGRAQVMSKVTMLTADVMQVEVTGWHKHTVSPVGGKFYFVREGDQWVRRTAANKIVKAALSK